MKKIIVFLFVIIAIVSTVSYIYLSYVAKTNNAKRENLKFEIYKEQEVDGTQLTTLINKAVNFNIQNEVEKDKKGKYKDNNSNSINIDIKFIDDDVTYNMEAIYKKGMNEFLNYYGNIEFKCLDVQYHNNTGKIKYMIFEQIK